MGVNEPDEIKAAFVTAIQAIDPRYPHKRSHRWEYVQNGEVSGAQIRRFKIEMQAGVPVPDGLHSQGEQYAFELGVVTGYGALPEGSEAIVQADQVDLRVQLEKQIGPGLPGLVGVREIGFRADPTADEHNLSGAHMFRVDYMQDTGKY